MSIPTTVRASSPPVRHRSSDSRRRAAGARADRQVRVHSLDFNEACDVRPGRSGKPQGAGHWYDYCEGMARVLREDGLPLRGANLLIASDVPAGSGLSSSAALEIAVGLALLDGADVSLDARRLALLGSTCRARFRRHSMRDHGPVHDCVRRPGARDSCSIAAHSRSEKIRLNTASVAIVVCDSGVKHALASSAYNERRRQCEEGVQMFAARHAGDHSPSRRLGRCLGPSCKRATRDTVTTLPSRRDRECAHSGSSGPSRAGRSRARWPTLRTSHTSLCGDDYEVSCDEVSKSWFMRRVKRGPGEPA